MALTMLEGAGDMGEAFLKDVPFGKTILKFLAVAAMAGRKVGYRSVSDIQADAVLHPKRMLALLALLPTESQIPSRLSAIRAQLLLPAIPAATRAANDDQQTSARSVAR